jgi:hypothetical protein
MEINKGNYKQILLRYLENELSAADRSKVEKYIRENEHAAFELHLLKQTRLTPDTRIAFPNKQLLFRSEEEVVVVRKPAALIKMYRFSAIAIAAAILAFAIVILLNRSGDNPKMAQSKTNTPEKQAVIEHNSANGPTAYNDAPDPKKNSLKIDQLKKKDGTGKGSPDKPRKDIKNPGPVKEEHPLIITVDQNPGKQPMALVQSKGTPIDNSFNSDTEISKENNLHKVSIPVSNILKQDYDHEQDNKTLAGNFFDFLNKISIKKKRINEKTYYALSIETPNIKIDKTFKSLIEQ